MFLIKKKKPVCEHDWFELDTCVERIVKESTYYNWDYEDVEFMYIYCPKCDFKRRVGLAEGRRIIRANEIKKSYQSI